jgi:uncharacterized protein (TIGR02284 family)
MATNDDVISTLNNLIETCKDGQNGFRNAAESATHPELKTLFNTYSQQRAQFAAELQGEVRRLGGDPEKTGSVAAAVHRGWMNLRDSVTTGATDDSAIVAECERGEDYAVSAYEDAIRENLPQDVAAIVQRQFGSVKEAHDRVRDLKQANEAGA